MNNKGKIVVRVMDGGGATAPIANASVSIYPSDDTAQAKKGRKHLDVSLFAGKTDGEGYCGFDDVDPGSYFIKGEAFGIETWSNEPAEVKQGCVSEVKLTFNIQFQVIQSYAMTKEGGTPISCDVVPSGTVVKFVADHTLDEKALVDNPLTYTWNTKRGSIIYTDDKRMIYLNTAGLVGRISVKVVMGREHSEEISDETGVDVMPQPVQTIGGNLSVGMRRTEAAHTTDLPLWIVIRKSTDAISFKNYFRFMDHVLCNKPLSGEFNEYELAKISDKKIKLGDLQKKRFLPFTDTDAYKLLKVATEAFLVVNCGVALSKFPFTQEDLDYLTSRISGQTIDLAKLNSLWEDYLEFVNGTSSQTLPYLALIRNKLPDNALKNSIFADADLPQDCFGILRNKLTEPCLIELIWSYWHEEGMLVQTMNAIGTRFQNRRRTGNNDPLANLEMDPLRPINNLLWGYIQDEQHRLSVIRRTYEYDHHYGLRLEGKALPQFNPADSRSKFLEAFHNLLYICSGFFQQDDDTTVISDGFPVLNALKEVHLLLSEGAHNQFGDLPSTARIEMLMEEWLLARPEFREFLPTRIMVVYPEPWMDRVDAMKKLQGWSDTSVLHFRDLGVFGEQILLSIRFGAWSDKTDPAQAKNWARYWRAEIQGYIHAYRAVTGVDLTSEPVNNTLPSTLLRERLTKQIQKR